MKRILLFVATNVAVLVLLSIVLRLLGVDSMLDQQGVAIDYNALLILSAVIGFGGSLISLAMSKWIAKRTTSARVISQPSNEVESWLLSRVQQHAQRAGIEQTVTPHVLRHTFATRFLEKGGDLATLRDILLKAGFDVVRQESSYDYLSTSTLLDPDSPTGPLSVYAVTKLEDGNIKRTATKIVYRDDTFLPRIKPIGHCRRRRFIEQAQDIQIRETCCILGGLSLAVTKISRYGNYCIRYGFT